MDRRQLEGDIENLKARVAGAGDPEGALARSLKATLEIQEKRLVNLETATTNLAVVDAELERIEQQVRLVREESAVSRLARRRSPPGSTPSRGPSGRPRVSWTSTRRSSPTCP